MDIKVLRYFLALTRQGSISAAANYLHLTQPTLSRQLSELEQQLGSPLFIRGSRQITLTDEGVRLRKRAEEILDLVKKTEQEFQSPAEELHGDIAIGGGETYAMGLIAQILQQLRAKYPHIHVHIYSGDADEVTERIDKGLLDFGLVIGAEHVANYESLLLPATDTWGVLMRNDSPLAGQATIRPEDLWHQPLIFSKQTAVDERLTRWLKRDLTKLNVVATYNLIYNASLLVQTGMGYALCIDKLINTCGESQLCFRPLAPALTVDIHLLWKRYQVFSKAADQFLLHLKQAFMPHN